MHAPASHPRPPAPPGPRVPAAKGADAAAAQDQHPDHPADQPAAQHAVHALPEAPGQGDLQAGKWGGGSAHGTRPRPRPQSPAKRVASRPCTRAVWGRGGSVLHPSMPTSTAMQPCSPSSAAAPPCMHSHAPMRQCTPPSLPMHGLRRTAHCSAARNYPPLRRTPPQQAATAPLQWPRAHAPTRPRKPCAHHAEATRTPRARPSPSHTQATRTPRAHHPLAPANHARRFLRRSARCTPARCPPSTPRTSARTSLPWSACSPASSTRCVRVWLCG